MTTVEATDGARPINGVTPAPRPAWSRRTWRIAAGAVVGLAAAAVYVSALAGSQFFADDYLYLQLVRSADVTLQWFAIDNYGHFAPLTRLAYLVLQRWFGLDYPVAALVPALLTAAIVAAVLAIGRLLLGRRAEALVLGIMTAQSFLLIRIAMWWGASVHVMGAAAAYLWCVACFIGYCQTRRAHYQVLAVVMLVGALLIQERPLIVIGYLVLIRYLFYCGLPWRVPLWTALRRDVWLWTPYFLVIAVYLWYRLTVFGSSPTPGDPTNAVTFAVSGFGRSFLPAVAGLRTEPYSNLITAAAVIGAVLLVLVLSLLAQVRRSVWRVVLLVAAGYLANVGLLALGRLVSDPIFQSTDLQYYLDPFLVLPLALALGLGCLPVRASTRGPVAHRARIGALGAACVAVLVANLVSWVTVVGANNQTVAHQYLTTAITDLRNRPAEFDLMRFKMPPAVVPDFIAPYNDQPGVMSLDPEIAARLDTLSDSKVAVLPDGHSSEVLPVSEAVVVASTANTGWFGGATVTEGPDGMCISGPPGSVMAIDLGTGVQADGLFFGLRYTAASTTAALVASAANGTYVYNWNRTVYPAGAGLTVFDRLEASAVAGIALIFDRGVDRFCVSGLWVGTTAVRDGSGCTGLDHWAQPTLTFARCEEQWDTVLG